MSCMNHRKIMFKKMGQIETTPVQNPNLTEIQFQSLPIYTNNGLTLKQYWMPEELIVLILSHVDIKTIPKCLLVCKKWREILILQHPWRIRCKRHNIPCKKNLPWYTYYVLFRGGFFDENLILNNCGQERLRHWNILKNGGDKFVVENPPAGANAVPSEVDNTSCFVTSFSACGKNQEINFRNALHLKILDELKPEIYVSEWYAGRFDCGCRYRLSVWLMNDSYETTHQEVVEKTVQQWEGSEWHKVELSINNYPGKTNRLSFYHEGRDTQFWAGHYGSKFTGAVVKILWNSIAS